MHPVMSQQAALSSDAADAEATLAVALLEQTQFGSSVQLLLLPLEPDDAYAMAPTINKDASKPKPIFFFIFYTFFS